MPAPPHTYRQKQQPTKIARHVQTANLTRQNVDASAATVAARATGFAEILKRSQFKRERLTRMRKLAESLRKFKEGDPSTKAGTVLKQTHEFLEFAKEAGELLAKMKEASIVKDVHTAIGTAKDLSGAGHKLDSAMNGVNAVLVAVAVTAFVARLTQLASRSDFVAALRGKRLDMKRLKDGVELAKVLKEYAKQPDFGIGEDVKAAAEFVKLAHAAEEKLSKDKGLSGIKEVQTMIDTAKKLSAAQHKLEGAVNSANAKLVASAINNFATAVESATEKVGVKW
ncbi:MAG: hypothetical protein ABIX46_09700 [Burkholderiaceae bacterium]